MLKNHFTKHWPIYVTALVLITVISYYIFFNSSVQVFHYDMIEQVIRFIMRGYNLVREKGVTFWDWNHYFGASIFVYGYYFLFSPFWILLAILPKIEFIPYAFMFVNILKLFLLFFTSYLYFSKIRTNKIAIYAGASILTFNGFVMGYYNYTFFTDVLIFVPLILYFIESYLDDSKKIYGLIFSVAVMAIINAYLTILFSIFILIYTLVRYQIKKNTFNLSDTIKDGLKFTLIYIIGLGLGSVIFLPNLQLLLSTSRITTTNSSFSMISLRDAFRYISSFLQPVVDRNNFNPLVNKNIVLSYGHSGGSAVYSLIISMLIIPQLLVYKKSFERNSLLLTYLFYFTILLFPSLYFLLQGNSDTRWMIGIIFINAYVVSLILNDLKQINKKLLLLSTFLVIGLLGFTYLISRWYGLQNEEIYFNIAKRNVIVLSAVIFIYFLSLWYFEKNKIFKYLLILTICFDGAYSMYNMFFNPVSSISMKASEIPAYQLNNTSVIDSIKKYDDGIYRIDVLENAGFNNPMSKEYMGFTFYSSVYNFNVDDFIQNNIASAGGWVVTNNIGKWQYKEMFASKYWFDLTNNAAAPYGYSNLMQVVYSDQLVDVYENNYPIPFIYSMNNTLNYNAWLELSTLDKMRTLMNQVITYDSPVTEPTYIDNLEFINSFGTDYELNFEEAKKDFTVYVELPRSEEVWIDAYFGGELVKSFYNYEPQYVSLYCDTYVDQIKVRVSNLYNVPEEEFINNLYIDQPFDYYGEWYSKISKGFANDIEIGQNSFEAKITLNNESYVVTSIAFDDSWTIYANNDKINFEKINGGFIGFKLPPGNYQINAEYFPKYLKIGAWVTLISAILISINFINRRRKKKIS